PIFRVNADLPAIWLANSAVAALNSAAGTTRLTSPSAFALAASINSPVSSISIAGLRPMARESATIGVEQNNPILTPGLATRASAAATARSQHALGALLEQNRRVLAPDRCRRRRSIHRRLRHARCELSRPRAPLSNKIWCSRVEMVIPGSPKAMPGIHERGPLENGFRARRCA